MARYLVTGAAGFIGSAVAHHLLAQGHEVVGLDNFSPAYDVRLKQWRLRQLEDQGGGRFRFYRVDVAQWEPLQAVFEEMTEGLGDKPPFEALFHLAAWAGVRRSVENPWIYYETNVKGTLNLLELARRHGVLRFILASTSSLYGKHNPVPYREDADTSRPLSPYAASKKAAEILCYTYHYLYNLNVVVLRYFTVYGPADRPDMSVFRFIRWIAEGEPVIVYGDGTQERDYTFVEDVVRGTVAALNLEGYEVVNLGYGEPVKINIVIQIIEQQLGRRAQRVYKPMHPADAPITWADISKARQLLSWQPRIPLEEGLRRSIAWYQENRSWVVHLLLPRDSFSDR